MSRLSWLAAGFVFFLTANSAFGQGGTCSQRMADGKYHQVPCTYNQQQPSNQPGQPSQPPQPDPAEAARQARISEARSANQKGIAYWRNGDYANAVSAFELASSKDPGDASIKENLRRAKEALATLKAEEARIQKSKIDAQKTKDALQKLADSFGSFAIPTELDFDSGGDQTKSEELEFTRDLAGRDNQRLTPCAPSGSTMVVDACDPGTDLPQGVGDAIEGVFKDSPRAVTDRVRKGFNAVLQRDWKLASAWLKDALNRDPSNVVLANLVALVSYDKELEKLRIPKDSDFELLFRPEDRIRTALGTSRQREFMIDSKGATVAVPDDYRGMTPTFIRLKDGKGLLQVPTLDDLNLVFPSLFVAVPPAKVPIYRLDPSGSLVELPRDYNGGGAVFIKTLSGRPVQVPRDHDQNLIFPGEAERQVVKARPRN